MQDVICPGSLGKDMYPVHWVEGLWKSTLCTWLLVLFRSLPLMIFYQFDWWLGEQDQNLHFLLWICHILLQVLSIFSSWFSSSDIAHLGLLCLLIKWLLPHHGMPLILPGGVLCSDVYVCTIHIDGSVLFSLVFAWYVFFQLLLEHLKLLFLKVILTFFVHGYSLYVELGSHCYYSKATIYSFCVFFKVFIEL